MIKLYDKYLKLKEKDSSKLYLFKCGMFYIFLDDDCDIINEHMILKKTKFGNTYKCGFPVNSLNIYLKLFKNNNLDVQVIENIEENYEKLVKRVNSINIDELTSMEALNIIKEVIDSE